MPAARRVRLCQRENDKGGKEVIDEQQLSNVQRSGALDMCVEVSWVRQSIRGGSGCVMPAVGVGLRHGLLKISCFGHGRQPR